MWIVDGHTSSHKDDGYSPQTALITDQLLNMSVSTITESMDHHVDFAKRTEPGHTLHLLASSSTVVSLRLKMTRRLWKEMFGPLEAKSVTAVNTGQ